MAIKVIPRSAATAADRWDLPRIDATAAGELEGAGQGSAHLLTAGQLDALQRRVHEEAHARGFDQGLDEGRGEIARRVARLDALIGALAYPFEALDETVEAELAALAVALASQLVRRELAVDLTLLPRMVEQCLAVLPVGVRDVVVHLHPDDETALREQLDAGVDRRWRIAADPSLAPGDLRVDSDGSQIDGRLDVRLHEILAAMAAEADDK